MFTSAWRWPYKVAETCRRIPCNETVSKYCCVFVIIYIVFIYWCMERGPRKAEEEISYNACTKVVSRIGFINVATSVSTVNWVHSIRCYFKDLKTIGNAQNNIHIYCDICHQNYLILVCQNKFDGCLPPFRLESCVFPHALFISSFKG